MWWFFLGILLFISPAVNAQDSLLFQQSREQVKHYIRAINRGNETDLNLWALAEVSRFNPDLQSFIKSYLNGRNDNNTALNVFQDTTLSYINQLQRLTFANKSPLLLITFLLTEHEDKTRKRIAQRFKNEIGYSATKIDYQSLIRALLRNQPITPEILPANEFNPLHFFLFFDQNPVQDNIITTGYLKAVVKAWNQQYNLHHNALGKTLYRFTLFRSYYLLNQYAKIDPLYHSIINAPNFPNSTFKVNVLRMVDYSLYRLGYYNRSLDIIRKKSLPLAQYLNQDNTVLKIRIAEGAYLYRIGRIEESKKIYLSILKKSISKNKSISEARIFNNLAINYWKGGEFDEFLNLQFKALKEAKNENIYEVEQQALKNLFIYYRANKDFSSAKEYLKQAQDLAVLNHDSKNLAQLSYYEGKLYRDSKSDLDHTLASFNHALNLISFVNYYRLYQNILTEKAQLLEKKQKYKQAKAVYQQVSSNALGRNDRRNILFASFNKANTYLELSQTDSAKVLLDSLVNENLNALDFYQLVKAKTVQARYLKKTGQPLNGSELLQPVIDQIVKRSRGSSNIETGFWQVQPEYLDAFALYANLLIDTGRPKKAVEVLDRFKTINDVALYQNPLVRSKILNEKELSEYKRLTDELDDLRRQLLAANKKQENKIKQQIDELSSQKNTLDRKINTHSNLTPISVNQIQHRLDAHQRVLHITELNDTYYLASISRTSVHFKKIPITPKLRLQFKRSVARMAQGKTDLTKLYTFTKLLGLNKLPAYVHKLTIIPDSYLYQLPIDVLPLSAPDSPNSYGEAHYLIERFETNYMTSLNDFKESSGNTHFKYGFAGYGVSHFDDDRQALIPLPNAKTEINAITHQLTALKNKREFLNKDATEQTFRKTAPNARILHLATHSKVDNQNPLFSSIYLRRSLTENKKDFPGRIFAYELFELNLSNELVMLNSCESGSGSYLQGTGVVGISRALRYAGAASLVLNLWSVNDMMASQFAVQFYKGINKGESKSEALRDAKLYFLKNKNANPHYWGSYMLLGNKGAIVKPYQQTNKIFAASFMFFFLGMALASSFVAILKRKKSKHSQTI